MVIDSDSDTERPASNVVRSNNNRDDFEELQTLAQHRIHRQPRSEDVEEYPSGDRPEVLVYRHGIDVYSSHICVIFKILKYRCFILCDRALLDRCTFPSPYCPGLSHLLCS